WSTSKTPSYTKSVSWQHHQNFGDKNSPQVSYLRSLQSWDHHFPGFEHETEGTEIIDGIYHVMCVKA
ncbi:Orn/Lys/Arg family decarboxylase, partial [Escherichia coli]